MDALRLVLLLALSVSGSPSHAQIQLGGGAAAVFATAAEGREILTRTDDFVRRMSPFDRAARMKTDKEVSEEAYLKFVGENVLPWNDADKLKIASALQGVQPELEALSLPFPEKVFLVQTTGSEEGGAAYTRANAIVVPRHHLAAPIAKIQRTICHELFHILSRANPDLRERLYAAIGFVKCDEVAFPFALKARMITNPDAPSSDHFIRLRVDSQGSLAIPILFSSTEKYDVVRGGEFFNYLQFQLLLVERTDGSPAVRPMYDGRNPKTVGIGEVSGFFEQVGNNTQYIIHPEEILADNFALLVLRNGSLPSPEILKKLEQILQETRKARPAPDSQRGVQSAHFPQKTSQCNAPPPAVSTLSSTSAAISTGPAPPSRRLAL